MAEHLVTYLDGSQVVVVDHPSEMPPMTPEALAACARLLDELRVIHAERALRERNGHGGGGPT